MCSTSIASLTDQYLQDRIQVSERGCWTWTGPTSKGYATINLGGTRVMAARVVYEKTLGPLPPGATLRRRCRNRLCVNPSHMALGNVADRFDEYVLKTPVCWLWTGARTKDGYGTLRVNGKIAYAHRYAYERAYGPVPEGLLVLHSCDNPACCRPDHLRAGTQQDNMNDMKARGRSKRQRLEPPSVQPAMAQR